MGHFGKQGWNTSCTSRASSGCANSERRACSQSPAPGNARAPARSRLRRQACAKNSADGGQCLVRQTASAPASGCRAQHAGPGWPSARHYQAARIHKRRAIQRQAHFAHQRRRAAVRPSAAASSGQAGSTPCASTSTKTAGPLAIRRSVSEPVSTASRPGRRHIQQARRNRKAYMAQDYKPAWVLLLALRGRCRRAPLPASGAPVY